MVDSISEQKIFVAFSYRAAWSLCFTWASCRFACVCFQNRQIRKQSRENRSRATLWARSQVSRPCL